jgi:hypothetical protein
MSVHKAVDVRSRDNRLHSPNVKRPSLTKRGRDAHLNGELAKALFAKAGELFSEAPKVHLLRIIAQK